MSRIDESRPFLPVNIAVLTVSDTRTAADDKSGDTLAELIRRDGHWVAARAIVMDDAPAIVAQLRRWIADPEVDVVIATGGTGVTGRDVTPEAFQSVYEKEIAGFGELFRWISFQKVKTSTIQSRATGGVAGGTGVTGRDVTPEAFQSVYEKEIAGFGELFRWISFQKVKTSTIQSRATGGVAGGTYLFALPGSPGACRDGWEEILRWQLDNRHRPCNLVELMPRLEEHRRKAK
jgi:molybdenum cofactor biosynthesis protein B